MMQAGGGFKAHPGGFQIYQRRGIPDEKQGG
jgi:hypothetical protein